MLRMVRAKSRRGSSLRLGKNCMLTRITRWLHRRKLARMAFYQRTQYSFDGVTIRAHDPLGADQSLALAKITDVGVETTCLGPFAEDVFWLINRDAEAIRIPQCSPIFAVLMKHFESIEGFDWNAFGRSMSSTEDAFFACWSSKATTNETTA